ncbi:MAG: hypothetical protein U9R26_01040 [Campylobacterota bacterium]|nr:hypothetical protein [Campylobacterota bacterium]
MKTTNYRLQTEIEHLGPLGQQDWFKNYLKEVLESDKPYYVKSDYIALSFLELDNKIAYLADEMKMLANLKKRLTEAKTLGLEIAAQMLKEYGIEKMEGTAISSLTIAPSKIKTKETIHIKDPNKVMELGYVNFIVDEKSVKEALKDQEMFDQLDPYIEVSIDEDTVPARLKINKKRNSSNITTESVEILDNPIERQAA